MNLIALSFAIFLLGAQLIKRSFLERRSWILAAASVTWVALGGGVMSFILYRAWSGNSLAMNYLPPVTPITYFLSYVGTRFFLAFGVSLVFAAIFVAAMMLMNRRCGGKFFDHGEIAVAGSAIFLSGFPGVLFFIPALIVFYLFAHIINFIRGRKGERIPLFYLWLPVALSVILINNFWLSRLSIWALLKV